MEVGRRTSALRRRRVLRGGAGVVTTASTKRGISTGVSGFAFQGTNAHVSMLQDENYSTACSMARLSYLSFARERLWAAGPCAADLTSMKFGAMRRGDIVFSLPRSATSLWRALACFAENQSAGLSLVHQICDFLHRATKSVVLTQIAFSNLRQLGSGKHLDIVLGSLGGQFRIGEMTGWYSCLASTSTSHTCRKTNAFCLFQPRLQDRCKHTHKQGVCS